MAQRAPTRSSLLQGLWAVCLLVAAATPALSTTDVLDYHLTTRRLLGSEAAVPVYWVLLVGDAAVGKSSMIQRFMVDSFSPDIKATEGASGKQREVQLKQGPARLQVWDTAGSPPFQKVVTSIYRGAHAVMVLYDPHNSTSFEQVGSHWAPEVAEFAAPGSLRCLVSTKDDLGPGHITAAAAQSLADAQNMTFIETSAKDNRNVTSLFINVGQRLRNAADAQATLDTS